MVVAGGRRGCVIALDQVRAHHHQDEYKLVIILVGCPMTTITLLVVDSGPIDGQQQHRVLASPSIHLATAAVIIIVSSHERARVSVDRYMAGRWRTDVDR